VPSSLRHRTNPHLAAHHGIVASAFVSLVIALAVFEQLGWTRNALAETMIIVPVLFYVAIALATRSVDIREFYACRRRVPPFFNGAVLAAVLIGGTGFFGYTGALFLIGYDALPIGLGWTAGLLAAGLLFVPFLRKSGAYTLPSFLGQRFRSREVRLTASLLQLPPLTLLLAAEFKMAVFAATLLMPVPRGFAVLVIGIVVSIIVLMGGMRSLTWTSSAQFVVAAVAFTAPLLIVSVLLTNLPLPQLTYGEILAPLQRSEIVTGATPAGGEHLATALPSEHPQPSTKPFLRSFGGMGASSFIAIVLCLVLGTAAMPSLLVRSGTTPSVADQRRSLALGALLVGLFALSAPALAVFAKLLIFQPMTQPAVAGALPSWLNELNAYGIIVTRDANGDGAIGGAEMLFARNGIVFALPMVAGLPFVCTVLIAAAGLALALAAAASHLFTLAGGLAEDIGGVFDPERTALPRLVAAWAAIVATALGAAIFLAAAHIDALHAAATAFSLTAATYFPVLLLSIWWKRCTGFGALVALIAGFVAMMLGLLFGATLGSGDIVASSIAALVSAGFAVVAGIVASQIGPGPSPQSEAYFAELRDPGGDAIYDRAGFRAAEGA
jgi:cation/acetate symporter